jgi:hypothetical protein
MNGIESLEQRCEEPGLWLIEGWQVRRVKFSRRGKAGQVWLVIWEPGEEAGKYNTLDEARAAIVDRINNA